MDPDVERLWSEYLEAERDRIHAVLMPALDRLIDELLRQPTSIWHEWARNVASKVSDLGADTPVRLPLFRRVLLPALAEGVRRGEPGCARWLASFESLLINTPTDELAPELRTTVGLLTEAVRLDPSDDVARRRLVDCHAEYLEYTLHELPSGVLYGQHFATVEQCDELLQLLDKFKEHVAATSQDARFVELIHDCELHFRAYADYRRTRPLEGGYEQYVQMKLAVDPACREDSP
jgi:hypothetical protein